MFAVLVRHRHHKKDLDRIWQVRVFRKIRIVCHLASASVTATQLWPEESAVSTLLIIMVFCFQGLTCCIGFTGCDLEEVRRFTLQYCLVSTFFALWFSIFRTTWSARTPRTAWSSTKGDLYFIFTKLRYLIEMQKNNNNNKKTTEICWHLRVKCNKTHDLHNASNFLKCKNQNFGKLELAFFIIKCIWSKRVKTFNE